MDIFDLEFALAITGNNDEKKHLRSNRVKVKSGLGVVIRSNVTDSQNRWDLVPGELLKQFNDENPYLRQAMTEEQRVEEVLYKPCSNCGARWQKNCCEST